MDNSINVYSNAIFLFHSNGYKIKYIIDYNLHEDSRNNSETDLNDNTEDEIQTDTSSWTLAEKKKLQHMIAFHTEYQSIFGE